MFSRRLFQQLLFIIILSGLLGFGINHSLIKRYIQGEFKQSFLSSKKYPSIVFITLAEAEELFARREAIFIDSRPARDYSEGHILGALNIPLEEQRKKDLLSLLSLPPEQTLVVYCDGDECQSSVELSKILHQQGFSSIKVFFGGWVEWVEAGLPIDSEDDKK
ncbi:MAG: rhodanese-like domain-containing protein [Candidatus Aminicenantales bacterium]